MAGSCGSVADYAVEVGQGWKRFVIRFIYGLQALFHLCQLDKTSEVSLSHAQIYYFLKMFLIFLCGTPHVRAKIGTDMFAAE